MAPRQLEALGPGPILAETAAAVQQQHPCVQLCLDECEREPQRLCCSARVRGVRAVARRRRVAQRCIAFQRRRMSLPGGSCCSTAMPTVPPGPRAAEL
jgi:hypothetical protein